MLALKYLKKCWQCTGLKLLQARDSKGSEGSEGWPDEAFGGGGIIP